MTHNKVHNLEQFDKYKFHNYKIIQSVFRDYGYKSIIIIIQRFIEYIYCIIFKRDYFIINNKKYNYFYHFYNTTFRKERAIEIPIVLGFVKKYLDKEILEVGNVLNHYYKFKHDVVDKFEVYPKVINEDIVTFKPNKKYDLIISISTIEHIGWDENPHFKKENKKEKNKILQVLTNLTRLLSKNGKLVVTFPLGYNLYLDKLLESKKLYFSEVYYMKRISRNNIWRQVNYNEVKDTQYGYPYENGNGLVLGVFHKQCHSFL